MKEFYTKPTVEIEEFKTVDIITTSIDGIEQIAPTPGGGWS